MTMTYIERRAEIKSLIREGDLKLLADRLVALAAVTPGHWGGRTDNIAKELGVLAEADRCELLLDVVARVQAIDDHDSQDGLGQLIDAIGGTFSSAMSPDAAEALLAMIARHAGHYPGGQLVQYAGVLRRAGRPLTDEAIAVIRRTAHGHYSQGADLGKLAASLTSPPLNCGEPWADRVNADLPGLDVAWIGLLAHAATATSAKPSAKWERQGRDLLAIVGEETAAEKLLEWLALVGRPRTLRLIRREYEAEINDAFDAFNATALRGLIWLTAFLPPQPEIARTLGGLVETSLRKVAGLGPRNPKTANAAVLALSRIESDAALAQIARLASRVTYKGTLKELNAALDKRAVQLGLTRDEVEELAVPTYGLTEVGRRVEVFGDASAEVIIDGGGVAVVWRSAAGKTVKSPPASVKADHADELRELKAAVKDIEKMLSAQSDRLDRQFLARRVWELPAWRERYLDHPLLGTLARRLIWIVGEVPCAYADGALRGVDDAPIEAPDDATVRLWHPIGREVDEVVAWRSWLERHGITQPFKQAHREVYLLTAAEERTGVYSNRYAAHVLRQHQFHALTAARGWRNRLRLMVDDTYPPATRELPEWGLRAEFWVEGIGDDYGTDTTESGSYLRIATDQVRFYPVAAPENHAHASGGGYEQWVHQDAEPTDPLPLDRIPPLVLSEVLRDVDLFVGVASVGNDPTWQDGGPEGRFREYWTSYSFGDLSATAETRRDLLTRLVPRLAIADRATVDGRFLVVRGDLRSYKIHLGSGNILMTPNDQYLCIVPKQSADAGAGGLFLPFEGDRVLAVILSKAMLLAKDTAITDPTITRQLRITPA
ncbi:hypothetical protein F4553_007495 [Allocatelliglobosispora scoriae]|uniref:DUF4132 domain-containing protein n=1 Tax=Allocatelliglobosispora scoriae TaxID=643052 RepID=A0A841C5H3_9ACTN|nr:DUF4132 domain-containing protein [Allocatelliglobosispora scoriae]MBB5874061.1 hypothetical protein [Allocatelliglobosispora scoriae]